MPQTYGAGAIFISNAVLEECDEESLAIGQHLNSFQLHEVRKSMETSHKIRHIPAGSKDFLINFNSTEHELKQVINIDDEKLQYTWTKFRKQSIKLMYLLAQTENLYFVLPEMLRLIRTKNVRLLLKEYRGQYDRRVKGSDSRAKLLREKIYLIITMPIKNDNTRNLVLDLIHH